MKENGSELAKKLGIVRHNSRRRLAPVDLTTPNGFVALWHTLNARGIAVLIRDVDTRKTSALLTVMQEGAATPQQVSEIRAGPIDALLAAALEADKQGWF